MPKKKLDLLELASRIMAEPRTGPPKIMGRETWNVFLKCCVLTVCRPDKHTEIADHFRYRLRLTTHQASLSPSSGRERFGVASLANEIGDRPALLSTLQAFQSQFRKFATSQSATEQNSHCLRFHANAPVTVEPQWYVRWAFMRSRVTSRDCKSCTGIFRAESESLGC